MAIIPLNQTIQPISLLLFLENFKWSAVVVEKNSLHQLTIFVLKANKFNNLKINILLIISSITRNNLKLISS